MTTMTKKSTQGIWHILLWIFSAYIYVQTFSFYQGNITNLILSGMYFILFGVHEAGHMIFGFMPDIFTAAAGSISEVVFTGLVVFAAVRAKSYWAAIFGLLWVTLAMVSMGNYMADAQDQLMPLIGPTASPVHDWNFVFSQLGWLGAAVTIGTAVKVLGWIVGAGALVFGLICLINNCGGKPK